MTLPLNHKAEYAALIAAQNAPRISTYLQRPCRPLAAAVADWGANAQGTERMAVCARVLRGAGL
jgi:hypothetical protein